MNEQLLVGTAWLAEHLGDAHLRIVDIRGHVLSASEPPPHYHSHRSDYDTAHIPGAVFVDWTADIVEPDSTTYDVANPQRYAALMSRLGIDDTMQVVAYDDAGGMFAARLWWTLNYYGHHRVAVVDGGWQKWLVEGRPTTAETPQFEATTFVARPQDGWRSDAMMIEAGGMQLLDVRSPAEFAGEASRALRAGHIPGAVNLPRKRLLEEDGTLRSSEALRTLFSAAGVDLETADVVVYCNSGVSASYGLLALRAAGYRNGRVYDGSWKDWGNSDRPIA